MKRNKKETAQVAYQPLTEVRFSGSPTTTDPLERRTVYVKDVPGKEEGLFARRPIEAGEQVAYYSGLVWNVTDRPVWFPNQTSEEVEEVQRNLIMINRTLYINVPKMYWALQNFRATLGHKTNHAFLNFNSIFNKVYHPRYGNILGIHAVRDIKKGEEILVNYGYDWDELAPKWYYDVYREEVGELPPKPFRIYHRYYL